MARKSLQRREKIAIAMGSLVMLAIGLTPLVNRTLKAYEQSASQLRQAISRLQTVQELREIIEVERSGQFAIEERLKARSPGFDLWGFTNQCLRRAKIEKLASLERKRLTGNLDGIQMSLRGVRMPELVDLLHLIYDSGNLIVLQRLDHLRPARDDKGLDCQLTFIAPSSR